MQGSMNTTSGSQTSTGSSGHLARNQVPDIQLSSQVSQTSTGSSGHLAETGPLAWVRGLARHKPQQEAPAI